MSESMTEMTLEQWCGKLNESHFARRQLRELQAKVKELESTIAIRNMVGEDTLSLKRNADNWHQAYLKEVTQRVNAEAQGKELESLVTAGMDLETKLHNECQRVKELEQVNRASNDINSNTVCCLEARINELTSSLNSYKGKLHASEVIRGELEEQVKGMRCCENCNHEGDGTCLVHGDIIKACTYQDYKDWQPKQEAR